MKFMIDKLQIRPRGEVVNWDCVPIKICYDGKVLMEAIVRLPVLGDDE